MILPPWLLAPVILLVVIDGYLYIECMRAADSIQQRRENRITFIATMAFTIALCAAGLIPGGWQR